MEFFLDQQKLFDYESTGDPAKDWEIIVAKCKTLGVDLTEDVPRFDMQMQWMENFCRASEVLTAAKKSGEHPPGTLSAPQVVSIAFALELALKTLAFRNNSALSGHKLKTELFDLLPPAAVETIRRVLPRVAQECERPDVNFEKLTSCLEAWNNAFIQWRYAFEGPKDSWLETDTARVVMMVLQRACQSKGVPAK